MKSVGIDIGGSKIKVAELDSSGRSSYAVSEYFEIPFTPDQDPAIDLKNAFSRIASHYDPTRTTFVLGIGLETVSARRKSLPFRERHKILKSLPFELEDEIPFDQGDAIFDCKTLSYAGATSNVLALACPKERLKNLIKLANDAGLDPQIISVDGISIANFFEDWANPPRSESGPIVSSTPGQTQNPSPGEDGETAVFPMGGPRSQSPLKLIVDIGHRKTLICAFQDRCLIEARATYFGAVHIAEKIQKKYSVSFKQALETLEQKGFVLTSKEGATNDQVVFSDTISEGLAPLVEELKLSLLEFKGEFGVGVQEILLLGGASRLLNLGAYLTSQLEVQANPLKYFGLLPKVEIPEDFEYSCASAIALAIEGFKRPKNPAINLRRLEFAKQNQNLKLFWERWNVAVKLGATALVFFIIFSFARDLLTSGLVDIAEGEIGKVVKAAPFNLKGKEASLSAIRTFVKRKKTEFANQEALSKLKSINHPLDAILEVTQKLPPKGPNTFDVRYLRIRDDLLTIQGEASTQDTINQIKQLLESASLDRKVSNSASDFKPSAGKVGFSYELRISRKSQGRK